MGNKVVKAFCKQYPQFSKTDVVYREKGSFTSALPANTCQIIVDRMKSTDHSFGSNKQRYCDTERFNYSAIFVYRNRNCVHRNYRTCDGKCRFNSNVKSIYAVHQNETEGGVAFYFDLYWNEGSFISEEGAKLITAKEMNTEYTIISTQYKDLNGNLYAFPQKDKIVYTPVEMWNGLQKVLPLRIGTHKLNNLTEDTKLVIFSDFVLGQTETPYQFTLNSYTIIFPKSICSTDFVGPIQVYRMESEIDCTISYHNNFTFDGTISLHSHGFDFKEGHVRNYGGYYTGYIKTVGGEIIKTGKGFKEHHGLTYEVEFSDQGVLVHARVELKDGTVYTGMLNDKMQFNGQGKLELNDDVHGDAYFEGLYVNGVLKKGKYHENGCFYVAKDGQVISPVGRSADAPPSYSTTS